tara:strand:- start:63 stop:971 length:909 start_codon:yes stop_codon:yes gene_type:complete
MQILKNFISSIENRLDIYDSTLKTTFSTLFDFSDITDIRTKDFFLALFNDIDYDNLSDNVLEFLYNYLYILKQYQILLNSFFASTAYRNCTVQIEKSSYIDDISNLILDLNTVINEINIEKNYSLTSDSSNSLIVYQRNIYTSSNTLISAIFSCSEEETTSNRISSFSSSNSSAISTSRTSSLAEIWKVKRINCTFMTQPTHFQFYSNKFSSFNSHYISDICNLKLVFPYGVRHLKYKSINTSGYEKIHVQDKYEKDSFSINHKNNRIYSIFVPTVNLEKKTLRIMYYTITNAEKIFISEKY